MEKLIAKTRNGHKFYVCMEFFKKRLDNEHIFYNIKNGYVYISKNRKILTLHRELIGAPPGSVVDHINGDKSDNRLCNLRLTTKGFNTINRKKNTKRFAHSKYKGVTKNTKCSTWTARLSSKYLGSFKTQEEAAQAYNDAVTALYGEQVMINNIP